MLYIYIIIFDYNVAKPPCWSVDAARHVTVCTTSRTGAARTGSRSSETPASARSTTACWPPWAGRSRPTTTRSTPTWRTGTPSSIYTWWDQWLVHWSSLYVVRSVAGTLKLPTRGEISGWYTEAPYTRWDQWLVHWSSLHAVRSVAGTLKLPTRGEISGWYTEAPYTWWDQWLVHWGSLHVVRSVAGTLRLPTRGEISGWYTEAPYTWWDQWLVHSSLHVARFVSPLLVVCICHLFSEHLPWIFLFFSR